VKQVLQFHHCCLVFLLTPLSCFFFVLYSFSSSVCNRHLWFWLLAFNNIIISYYMILPTHNLQHHQWGSKLHLCFWLLVLSKNIVWVRSFLSFVVWKVLASNFWVLFLTLLLKKLLFLFLTLLFERFWP
jgi:hypothetical protein